MIYIFFVNRNGNNTFLNTAKFLYNYSFVIVSQSLNIFKWTHALDVFDITSLDILCERINYTNLGLCTLLVSKVPSQESWSLIAGTRRHASRHPRYQLSIIVNPAPDSPKIDQTPPPRPPDSTLCDLERREFGSGEKRGGLGREGDFPCHRCEGDSFGHESTGDNIYPTGWRFIAWLLLGDQCPVRADRSISELLRIFYRGFLSRISAYRLLCCLRTLFLLSPQIKIWSDFEHFKTFCPWTTSICLLRSIACWLIK